MTYKSKVGYSSTAGYTSSVGYRSSSGFSPIVPITFNRQWAIGNMGDSYGYHVPNAYGGLVSNLWFNFIDTVDILIVDDSSNSAILQSDVMSMWGLNNTVTLQVEGFGDVILTWNGATAYVNVGDTAFVSYVMGQLGNSIGINILPINDQPIDSNKIVTTQFDFEIDTEGDTMIHTS